MCAPNRLASSTSKPASSLFCTALKGKPPLEMPTTSVPFVPDAGSSGIVWLRLVIQRSTMSAQTPFWRMPAEKGVEGRPHVGALLGNPAATGDLKIGLPKGTRSVLTRITSFSVSMSLSPASTFPALTASVTS